MNTSFAPAVFGIGMLLPISEDVESMLINPENRGFARAAPVGELMFRLSRRPP